MKDFGTGIVLTAPSPATSGTTLVLESGHGARMPAVPFKATAQAQNILPTLDTAETIVVTDVTGDTLTFTRAFGDTTAQAIAVGWRITASVYAENVSKIGDIIISLRATAPTGRLFMDGSTYNKVDYPLLWQHIVDNPAYGTTDATTLTLTDMTKYVPVGVDTTDPNIDTVGDKYGSKTHTLTTTELPSHSHSLSVNSNGGHSHTYSYSNQFKVRDIINAADDPHGLIDGATTHNTGSSGSHSHSGSVGSSGSGGAHNNMQPSIAVRFEVVAG